ncbi:class I SAM-dependent methyltransferase [Desulfosoma sp.]|uniref:class I SAM-dependent methyltransferase n=1 Tax=Desulfosoma sp. TaxID=2603217 RepID=UPI00404B1AE6
MDPTPFLEPLTWFLSPPAHILDVGCGSGRDLLWFQRRGSQVTGVERSAGLARLAREITKATIYEADFGTLGFSCLCVHALVLIGALVHHPHGRFAEALKRMLQALKKPGFILLSSEEGRGTRTASDGRVFYLWRDHELRREFNALRLSVLHQRKSASLTL